MFSYCNINFFFFFCQPIFRFFVNLVVLYILIFVNLFILSFFFYTVFKISQFGCASAFNHL